MGRKLEVTGKAVIYTKDGVKVIDAEVRRQFNTHLDTCSFKFKYDGDYLLIGGARTVPNDNPYAMPAYNPERVQRALKYANTKFFRQILDLMKLAQWQPIHPANLPLENWLYRDNRSEPLPVDDKSLYERYGFSPAMIQFTEAHFP